MTNNEKQYYIFIRSTGERVPVSKEEFNNYYREINAFRQRQQYHGKCVCPAKKRLSCDMDCFTCPFRRAGDAISLDFCMNDDEGNEKVMVDTVSTSSPLIEDLVADRIILESLVARLTEIMPQALEIINMRLDGMTNTDISKASLTFFDEEMDNCTSDYAAYVSEQVEKAKSACEDPIVLVEQHLDFSKWVPDGFGTGDCVIVADGTLSIIDLKYGKGVEVDAEDNSQLMLYSLGALELFDGIYDIDTVSMTIFQPRRDNISTYTISKDDLLSWAETVLVPAAELAAKGEGEFKAGEHCRFCKVRTNCRKRAEYNLELARYDFEPPAMLDDIEIAAILAKADELISWAADVKEYALRQALSGVTYDGFKVVEGRSNRKYTDEKAVIDAVKSAGYDPYEHSILGITAMTTLLGKKKFNELLGGLIEKPQGKPTLVPLSDKRPAINTANDDFKEEN